MDRWSWTISIPGTPSMVPVARTFVRAFLGDHPYARDAELIASEYVTNAIRHTASGEGGAVHVTVAATQRSARIEVIDHGPAESAAQPVPWQRAEAGGAPGEDGGAPGEADHPARPVPAPRHEPDQGEPDPGEQPDDESGRGLLIVDALATHWGHYGVSGGPATAWAILGGASHEVMGAEYSAAEDTAAEDTTGEDAAGAADDPRRRLT